jgi:type II secretory pathway pseudopilin PulG
MENNQIQPLDIEFDDILTPQPVGEEPAKEEAVETEKPTADIVPADIDSEEEEKEVEKEPVAEEPAPEPEVEEGTIVGEIIGKFGFDDIDEEFEDTTEGLTRLTEVLSEKLAVETLDSLFEKFPTVKKHLEYVQQGGDPNEFMRAFTPEVDYSRVELKEDDVNAQKKILTEYFIARGTEKDFIGDMLESYEDKGTLKDKAVAAKRALSDAQAAQREAKLQQQREQYFQQQKQTQKMWEDIGSTISNATDLSGIPISQRDKNKFYDYISKPVDSYGNTQRDVDMQKAELDTKLAMDFLMFKGFEIDKFIGKKASTKAAQTLKEKLERNSKRPKSVRTGNGDSNDNIESIDLDFSNLGG